MALTVQTSRTFKLGDKELPDPNPNMTVKEVIKFYTGQHPELASASVPVPKATGNTFVYEFNTKIEGKG